ncbi:MAG: inorganic diphosphatase [Patescibacteria group bacterium]
MDISKVPAGKDVANGLVNAFIEIPLDSDIKYELDKDMGVIIADRFMFTALRFPFNYGFIPQTMGEDGDPLDILLVGDKTVYPGVVVAAQVIGMLEMEDEAGIDTKIIAVPTAKVDPQYGVYQDITDVPEAIKNKIRHFFETYKALEPGKWVKLKEWKDKTVALEVVKKSLK